MAVASDKPKAIPLNCYRCGRFVGKGGNPDSVYDDWNGAWEIGYSECAQCWQETLAYRKEYGRRLRELDDEWGGPRWAVPSQTD